MKIAITLSLLLSTPAWAGPGESSSSWRSEVRLEAARLRAAEPDRAYAVLHLKGTEPTVYLDRRRAAPSVSAELRHADAPAPLLIALYLDGFEGYGFAKTEAYPPSLTSAVVAQLRVAERAALVEGVISALGAARHPAVSPFLRSVVADESATAELRGLAAQSLAESTGAEALDALTPLVRNLRAPMALRARAIAALGHVRTRGGLALLLECASTDAQQDLRHTAISAAASLASPSALRAAGVIDAEELGRSAADGLTQLLLHHDGATHADVLVMALGIVGDELTLKTLADAAQSADPDLGMRARRAAARIERALRRAAR